MLLQTDILPETRGKVKMKQVRYVIGQEMKDPDSICVPYPFYCTICFPGLLLVHVLFVFRNYSSPQGIARGAR
jgi:hypothetical protein